MAGIKVLIADDVLRTRKEIQRLLGFEQDIVVIGEACDGEEAVRLATELQPDVVLMDVNMPVMDGIVATEQISLRAPQVATIIISIQGEHEYLKKAMAAGAREYLVKPLSSDELLATVRNVYQMAACRREVYGTGTGMPGQAREGRMLVVMSPKGGVGKTTIATNTGIALAQAGTGRVALVDLDLQFGDAGLMMNLSSKRAISDLVREEEEIDAELVQSYLMPHFSGLKVLVGPATPQDAEAITSEAVMRVLSQVKKEMDWVVVDTAPGLNEVTLDVLEACDHILLLVTPDLAAVKNTRACLQVLETLHLKEKTRIIMNRDGVRPGLLAGDVEKGLGFPVWHKVANDEAVVVEAINKGLPLLLGRSASPISQSIKVLAERFTTGGAQGMTGGGQRKGLISKVFCF